ncbi:uncharacterized protein LOC131546498 isoform X2 [Onychostoma macrolepis]|uniref:DUF4806 domain-containing protein n=1 Tax=Onychostoma macrolepis TaxID=369639 RepID=A0A7J6CPP1_9TELE|nr:uncharacterized protein LOC131546498 isoform X2 [Onychostoma macrolepis]KAF4109299.1 hypothetical protein G5714_010372 [Onychostoma macrolepis]
MRQDPGHLNVNRASQLKGAGSIHQSSHSDVSQHSDGSQYSGGSHHSKRYRHRKQSRHSDQSRDSNQMRQDYEIDQTPISRYSGRSFSEQSNRSSAHESSHTGPRRETDLRFPMDMAKFQRKVLSKLVDIHMEVRRLGRSEPPLSSAHIEQLETMEDFEREEERLKDKQAFDSLVLQLARIGGKDVRDCVHKILDRLFTNRLMAKFNMKGKGKQQKLPLETTKTYEAINAAVMKWDRDTTEATIKFHAAEHLKHAPGRKGGGGHTGVGNN